MLAHRKGDLYHPVQTVSIRAKFFQKGQAALMPPSLALLVLYGQRNTPILNSNSIGAPCKRLCRHLLKRNVKGEIVI